MLLFSAAIPGCYHAGNDTLARAAQSSFQEARIGGGLEEELALSKELLAADLKAVRRETEAERDLAIAVLLDAPWGATLPARRPGPEAACEVRGAGAVARDGFFCGLAMQVARVAGQPREGDTRSLAEAVLELRKRLARVDARGEKVARDEAALRRLLPAADHGRLTCPDSGKPDDAVVKSNPRIKPLFDFYAASCDQWRKAQGELDQLPIDGGLLLAAQRDLVRLRQKFEGDRREAEALTAAFNAARAKAGGGSTTDAVKAGIQEARDALQKLTTSSLGIGGKLGNRYARLAEVRARYESLVGAADDLLAGKSDFGRVVQIVVRTDAELKDIENDHALLLLEIERLRGEVAVLKVQVEHGERRLALLEARRRGLVDQLSELLDAGDAAVQAVIQCRVIPGERVADTLRRVKERDCRDKIAESMLHYANSWTLGELRARMADHLGDGDLHDEAVEASAAAMKLWEQVLAVPIDALVRRHASGVKPEEIAKVIFQAIGAAALVGIAARGL